MPTIKENKSQIVKIRIQLCLTNKELIKFKKVFDRFSFLRRELSDSYKETMRDEPRYGLGLLLGDAAYCPEENDEELIENLWMYFSFLSSKGIKNIGLKANKIFIPFKMIKFSPEGDFVNVEYLPFKGRYYMKENIFSIFKDYPTFIRVKVVRRSFGVYGSYFLEITTNTRNLNKYGELLSLNQQRDVSDLLFIEEDELQQDNPLKKGDFTENPMVERSSRIKKKKIIKTKGIKTKRVRKSKAEKYQLTEEGHKAIEKFLSTPPEVTSTRVKSILD